MELILLTKSTTPIIGWVAALLGLIMDGIFRVLSNFGTPNIGLCIIIFTIIINLFLYPLTIQQQKSSKLQAVMQPELQAIQKKYKDKKDNDSMIRMQNETKAVYTKYGTSMTGGCLMLVIQMPILFALYQVIYKIPAYVPGVKAVFENIATPLMQQPDFTTQIADLAKSVAMSVDKFDYTSMNYVIDFLYKLTPAKWDTMKTLFPAVSDTITTNLVTINQMNNFLGVNLSTPPFQGWMPNLAWLIPILAGLTQWYSVKLMSAGNAMPAGDDDPNGMASQMKTMNNMMPLMSVFFCFTLASGLGVYWVVSAVCRILQQFIINRKLSSMDIDTIVKENIEKANKKRAKQGLKPQDIQAEKKAIQNAKNYEQNAAMSEVEKERKLSSIAKQVKDSTAYYNQNAAPGSLASKANMVALYEQKQAEKKRGKKAAYTQSTSVSQDKAASGTNPVKTEQKESAKPENTAKSENTAEAEDLTATEDLTSVTDTSDLTEPTDGNKED